MLHRIKKYQDPNEGKWIGIGGKLELHESPRDCILREAQEEAGLKLRNLRFRGIITFILPKWEDELTFLYTAHCEDHTLKECDEGELQWVDKNNLLELNLWEGDRCFLGRLFESDENFNLKLIYDEQDNLIECIDE